MKIVATVSGSTFLAELSASEIDFLAGKRIGREGNYSWERMIAVGTTFNIVNAINQVHHDKRRKVEIETVRRTLEGIINSLDIIDPFIEEPKVEEKPAEG